MGIVYKRERPGVKKIPRKIGSARSGERGKGELR